ncbi:HlyD family efflux transporter periplasmic adaptor subunit [Rhodobacteraceae bacterium CCMM004]|nr:HlyD family efflux transporter periplasmic adaptor subunit [Rhodobacteraceae bacterium CCMM004]
MRFLRRSLVGLFLLAVTLGLLALAGQGVRGALEDRASREDRPRQARERVFAANVVPLVPETIVPVLSTFGEVRSRRTLDVRTAVSGAVIELGDGVEEGGAVAAGQFLLRIDPAAAETALALARTDLQDAEAEVRDARRSVELAGDDLASARAQADLRTRALTRQRDLRDRGVGTEAAVEAAELAAATADQAVLSRRQALAQAEARADQAETRLARTRIAVAEAERDLAETEIRAEFAGVLADVAVVRGGLVSTNERLARLIDPEALEVAFRVSTAQYARLLDAEGRLTRRPLRIALEVAGLTVATTGTISRESAAVGEGQTGRLLFAALDAAQGFRPGDFAVVSVEEPPLDRVARLPASAVASDGTVLVLGAEDRLEVADVQLLRRQGDDVIVRAADLAGREVVAERSPLLGAGIKVRPIRPADLAAEVPAGPDMVELSDERRAKLVAFVEGNPRMPAEAKERVLAQLRAPQVPAQMVERIESRMGG